MRDDRPERALTRARAMRQSPTEPEKNLWSILRDRRLQGLKFRRQVPTGPYIVDFLCISHALVIEADGSQHADSSYDATRDAWLKSQGYQVLRFWNMDVLKERTSVLDSIAAACGLPW
jgi:very-short-patch-repair endonuclease